MRAKKEIREEREDVVGFYEDREIVGINGTVLVEEKIDETTENILKETKQKLESELQLVNDKLLLIAELYERETL